MANSTTEINHNYIKQLYTIIDEEMKIYKDIAKTEQEKYELLMKSIFTDLEPINEKLTEQIKASIKMEQKRLTVSGFVINDLQLAEDSSFKQIVEELPEEYSEKFFKMLNDFNGVIKEVKRLNEVNSRLILDSKRLIDVTLNAYIDGDSSIEINYGNQIKKSHGKNIPKTNPKLFNRKV